MRKTHQPNVRLVPIADEGSSLRTWGSGTGSRLDELEAIERTVVSLRETLLDFNPMLAVCADSLARAVALEIETLRCAKMLDEDG
jgi:hypothetical protein